MKHEERQTRPSAQQMKETKTANIAEIKERVNKENIQ
jgi:hypothetical protein